MDTLKKKIYIYIYIIISLSCSLLTYPHFAATADMSNGSIFFGKWSNSTFNLSAWRSNKLTNIMFQPYNVLSFNLAHTY